MAAKSENARNGASDGEQPTKDPRERALRLSRAIFPSRLSAQVALTLAARLWTIVNQLAVGLLVSRLLGVESWGVLASLNVLVLIAVQSGAFGLTSASTYFVAEDRRRFSTVASNAFLFALLVGGALAVVSILVAQIKSAWLAGMATPLVVAASFAIPFQLVIQFSQSLLLGAERVGRYNVLDVATQSLTILNAVVAVWLLQRGLYTLVLLNTVSSVVVSGLALYLSRKTRAEVDARGRLGWDGALFAGMARYGFRFYIALVVSALIIRADLVLVNYWRGPAEAGVYAVASQVGQALMLLPVVIGTLLFPRVAATQDKSGLLTCKVTRHTAFIMLLAHIAAGFLSFTLPVLYGSAFADLGIQVLFLLPGAYLLGLESVQVQHLSGTGFPAAIPLFWLCALLVNVALNFVFVPRYGARAAALSSSVCYVLIFILVAAYFRRKTGRTFAEAFILRGAELRGLFRISQSSSGTYAG